MKSYLDRYGVTEEALLTLSVTVFLFSSATVPAASETILDQHKGEVNILRSLDASRKLLKGDILKLLPWSLIASSIEDALPIAVLRIAQGYDLLQALSHTVTI